MVYIQLFAIQHNISPSLAFYILTIMQGSSFVCHPSTPYIMSRIPDPLLGWSCGGYLHGGHPWRVQHFHGYYNPTSHYCFHIIGCRRVERDRCGFYHLWVYAWHELVTFLIFMVFLMRLMCIRSILFPLLYGGTRQVSGGNWVRGITNSIKRHALIWMSSIQFSIRLGIIHFFFSLGLLGFSPIAGALLGKEYDWAKAIVFNGVSRACFSLTLRVANASNCRLA